jgi:HSP20 family molecular chaperone IbpA
MWNPRVAQPNQKLADAPVADVSPPKPNATERPPLALRDFPELRLLEDETSLTVVARVPGFSRHDLSIALQPGLLTISGRARQHVPDGFSARTRNRAASDFTRCIQLVREVVGFAAKAIVQNGVLTVQLQKHAGSSRTLIPLRFA